jgi:hypothetical protein
MWVLHDYGALLAIPTYIRHQNNETSSMGVGIHRHKSYMTPILLRSNDIYLETNDRGLVIALFPHLSQRNGEKQEKAEDRRRHGEDSYRELSGKQSGELQQRCLAWYLIQCDYANLLRVPNHLKDTANAAVF